MKKTTITHAIMLSTLICTMSATTSYAAKPVIENRGLTSVKPLETQATKEWQMYQRIQAQDKEIAKLRDSIERLENRLNTLTKDTRKRLKAVEERTTSHEASLLALTTEADEAETSSTDADNDTQPSNNATNPLTTPNPSVDENAAKKDYLAAYDAFKKSGAKAGVKGMDNFINKHAGSKLIPSAHYWAGEFYLSEKNPDLDAAELRFATVANNYPTDAKAPRALYRLANMADAEGKITLAKKHMKRLITNYPKSKEATLAKTYLQKKD